MNINDKIYVELYNAGKTIYELSKIFDCSERSIERYENRLRKQKKIKFRKELPPTKTVSTPTTQAIESVNWKIRKTKKKEANFKKPFSTYLVIADTHIPYENEVSIKSIFHLMDDISFDGFVILGDYMDMSPISHWLKHKRKTLENKRMLTDYVEGNKLLDEFDKRLPKNCDKRFFYGNHEDWYYQLIEEYPALEGLLEPKIELKLEERGYKVYDKINNIEKIGRISNKKEI